MAEDTQESYGGGITRRASGLFLSERPEWEDWHYWWDPGRWERLAAAAQKMLDERDKQEGTNNANE